MFAPSEKRRERVHLFRNRRVEIARFERVCYLHRFKPMERLSKCVIKVFYGLPADMTC